MTLKYDTVSMGARQHITSASVKSITHQSNKCIDPHDFSPNRTTTVSIEDVDEGESGGFDQLSKEQRLERAKEIMDEKEPLEIDLEMGAIRRLNESTLVERTESGFNLYHIQ